MSLTTALLGLFYRPGASQLNHKNYNANLDLIDAAVGAVASNIADHLADTTAAHAASAVSFAPGSTGLSSTDVQGALEELAGSIGGGSVAAEDVTFDPAGNIAATDVQAAIEELDSEKLAASAYTASDVLDKIKTVDGTGSGLDADLLDGNEASAFALASHTHTASQITDFQESTEDVVGTLLTGSESTGNLDWTYTDGSGTLNAVVKDNAITDAKLRDSAAVSVIGRSANSSGDPADIAAGANDRVLRRVSNALDFGQLTVGMAPNNVWTYATIQQVSASDRVLGRVSSGAGNIEEITFTDQAQQLCDDTSFSAMRTTLGLAIGTDVQAFDADTLKADTDDQLTAGFTGTVVDDGTKSGAATYTPSPSGGNFRKAVNGGAFTLAAPSASGDYTMVIKVTNNGSAGTITPSGFTKITGDNFTTTNGHIFLLFITKLDGSIHLHKQAMQ